MTSGIDVLLDGVEWERLPDTPSAPDELVATHVGYLNIGGIRMRCYRLNDDRRVFDVDDVASLFAETADEVPA